MRNIGVSLVLCVMFGFAFPANASTEVDADAAKAFARRNNCFKCHGVDKKEKDGPTYKEVAEKYRGKPGAEEILVTHLTSGVKIKFRDGHEEEHRTIKSRDMRAIKNLVAWILSL